MQSLTDISNPATLTCKRFFILGAECCDNKKHRSNLHAFLKFALFYLAGNGEPYYRKTYDDQRSSSGTSIIEAEEGFDGHE